MINTKKFSIFAVVAIAVCGIVFSVNTIVKAYTNQFWLSVNNNKVQTSAATINPSYANSLEHAIIMYGTDATPVNYIQVVLQKKAFFIWGNVGSTIYTTTSINQPMNYSFGHIDNGTFRLVFDAATYPYQGIYEGKVEHFALNQ